MGENRENGQIQNAGLEAHIREIDVLFIQFWQLSYISVKGEAKGGGKGRQRGEGEEGGKAFKNWKLAF